MANDLYTDRLSVGYDGRPLIEDIRLKVQRGEIMTLIGPNGAGKSTILKTLSRQLAPIAGAVYLDNRPIGRMEDRELAQKLSIVTTERINPELMTCWDVVSTGRYPYTGRLGLLSQEDRQIVMESLARVHGEELAKQPFSCISDGQRQRVLLARALCQQPEVILLDEPTSFLDIRHKLELLDILKRLVREQRLSVVMSLHELDLAQKISDTVVCVHGDRIDRCGPPEEIFTESYIHSLYGLTAGSYDALFGCVELEPVRGTPQVFVIGGGGYGIPLYRKLQRQGIPCAAGILPVHDRDYPVAKALCEKVLEIPVFTMPEDTMLAQAKALIDACETVYCPCTEFGVCNSYNQELYFYAKKQNKLKNLSE